MWMGPRWAINRPNKSYSDDDEDDDGLMDHDSDNENERNNFLSSQLSKYSVFYKKIFRLFYSWLAPLLSVFPPAE